MDTPELTASRIARDVDRRMESVARFATTDYRIVPANLAAPFNKRNWAALAPDIRLDTLRKNVTKQIAEKHKARAERRKAREAAEAEALARAEAEAPLPRAEAEAPLAKASAPRYVVACAAGCGELHPASSPEPALVFCGGVERTAKRGKRTLYGGDEGPEATERLIARLKRETEWAKAESDAPRRKNKPKKERRRAVCSATR